MSYAPQTLLDARKVYQKYTGLPNNQVGIVGDEDHKGGYHCGWDLRRIKNGQLDDYSWEESSRDWNHKTNAASAMDFGWFEITLNGKRCTLIDFNVWLVKELNAGAPDTLDIRELIYTDDGKTVKRWDRLKLRTSGDSSHLTHTHCSRFRDAENKPFAPLIERFFGGTVEPLQVAQINNSEHYLQSVVGMTDAAVGISNTVDHDIEIPNQFIVAFKKLVKEIDSMKMLLNDMDKKIDALGNSNQVSGTLNISGGVLNIGPSEE